MQDPLLHVRISSYWNSDCYNNTGRQTGLIPVTVRWMASVAVSGCHQRLACSAPCEGKSGRVDLAVVAHPSPPSDPGLHIRRTRFPIS